MKKLTIRILTSLILYGMIAWPGQSLHAQIQFNNPSTTNNNNGPTTASASFNPYEIGLKSREFTPDVNQSLSAAPANPNRSVVLLQFNNPVDAEILQKAGLTCLGSINEHAIMTEVPAGFSFQNIPDLRYAGKLLPSDRMCDYASEHMLKSGGNETFLVEFMKAPTANMKAGLMAAVGGTEVTAPGVFGKRMLVNGPSTAFDQLKNNQWVAWISMASDEMKNGKGGHFCPGPIHPGVCAKVPFAKSGGDPQFATIGEGWDGAGRGCSKLLYHFVNNTPDIPGTPEFDEIRRAIQVWETYATIFFSETATAEQNNSIDISWEVGNHGDGLINAFDGMGGVLAHAFVPNDVNNEPIAGDLHFDDAETWYIWDEVGPTSLTQIDVMTVALHELGHSLGLDHSTAPNSVMFAFLGAGVVYRDLTFDDQEGIQSIYGGSGWVHQWVDPNRETSDSDVAGDIEVAPNGHVRYRHPNGRMINMFRSGPTWARGYIAPNWSTNDENIKKGGSIAVDQTSGQTYYHGEDNKLQNMRWTGGQWVHGWVDPNWSDSQWDVAGEIEVAPNGQVRHRANNGRIVNKYWNSNSGWNTAYLTPNWTTNSWNMKAGGSIAIDPVSGQTYYHGDDNRIHNYYFSGGTWNHGWPGVDWTSNERNVKGDIEVGMNGHVYYHGIDNKLHVLFWDNGSWNHDWVTPKNGSNDWDVAGDIEVDPNGQIRYRLNNGRIANIWFGGGQWNCDYLQPCWNENDWNMIKDGAMSIGQDGHTYYHGDDQKLHKYLWIQPLTGKNAPDQPDGENMEIPVAALQDPELQAVPNPFSEQLELRLDLDMDTEVKLEVLDMQGRIVATPAPKGVKRAGKHSFEVSTKELPAGMYFARLQYGSQSQSVKMIKVD